MDGVRKFLGLDKDQEGDSSNNSSNNSGNKINVSKLLEEFFEKEDVFDQIPVSTLTKELQQQMQEVMKQFEEGNDFFSQNSSTEFQFDFNQPTFEEQKDQEIKEEDFKKILDKNSPIISSSPRLKKEKPKQSDEERVMDKIHGTVKEDEPVIRKRIITNLPPGHPKIEVIPDNSGRKSFFYSTITSTIRKPDGSTETKKIIRDNDGNVKTIITRTADGHTETKTFTNNSDRQVPALEEPERRLIVPEVQRLVVDLGKNFSISSSGYVVPRNMW